MAGERRKFPPLSFFVKGARTAIVYVLTVLETQNLEPDRTILSFIEKKHNNQPKTRGLDGGETRHKAQPAGGAVGVQVDRFRAIELG